MANKKKIPPFSEKFIFEINKLGIKKTALKYGVTISAIHKSLYNAGFKFKSEWYKDKI